MKNILVVLFLLSTFNTINAQLKSEVSECFELTGIVFHLAGAPEYFNNQLIDYTNGIEEYFASYVDHPLIPYLKELREIYGISYDAVAKAAACLAIEEGQVIIKPGFNISKISELDYRWRIESFETFVWQLNDFYEKSDFRSFYLKYNYMYTVAVERMDELLTGLNLEWFESFFGNDPGDVCVVASLCGTGGYGLFMDNNELKNRIVIGVGSDVNGLPWFHKNMVTIIVHELLHNYTNSRIETVWDQIEFAAEKIYSYVKEDMYKSAYSGANITIYEWLTNLCMLLYIQDNSVDLSVSFEYLIRNLQERGFIWMDRSIQFMKHFYDNRNLFLTFDDYIPQVVGFINYTADDFSQVLHEYNNRHPYVVGTFPISGSILPQGINTVEFHFSKPMYGPHGISFLENDDIIYLPFSDEPFWRDEYTFVYPFDYSQLEKGKTYGFKLLRIPFQSEKIYPMKEDYIYTINTCEK